MKASAAFAVGLWTGAVVVAAVGVFHLVSLQTMRSEGASGKATELAAKEEQIRLLEQEKARLTAETQRLKETISDLKSNLDERAAIDSQFTVREFPLPEPGATQAAPEKWMEEAVAQGKVEMMPRMEALALHNSRYALEALALMAEQDAGEALTRVWSSGKLNQSNRAKAARFIGATLEVNPVSEELLQSLFADPTSDSRVLDAALDGIVNPNFPVSLGRNVAVPPPPHFKPDLVARVRLLDSLRKATADDQLRWRLVRARDELLTNWTEVEPGTP